LDFFKQGLEAVNPGTPLFVVSSRTGEGVAAWVEWLTAQREALFASA
jgi:hydrogenase nickel incorporation protein HypB